MDYGGSLGGGDSASQMALVAETNMRQRMNYNPIPMNSLCLRWMVGS